MRIIIFGPQGSGKGTQAELIARRHGWPYISTGDIFRYHRQNDTELGKQITAIVQSGQLVPDDVTNEVVRQRLEQPDCVAGFVLDGYPRTQAQVDFLEHLHGVDLAIVIDLADDVAIARLSQRLACTCGLSYHPEYNPPKAAGVCDRCGLALFRRDDDQPEAISRRLDIYHQQTEPLLAAYAAQGKLVRIDGVGAIEQVYGQIDQAITARLSV